MELLTEQQKPSQLMTMSMICDRGSHASIWWVEGVNMGSYLIRWQILASTEPC